MTIRGRSPFAGAKVAELSPRLAQRLGLDADIKGVTVVDIDRNSPAAGFGFQPRDIVREVNGEEIDTAEKLKQVAGSDTRWWRFTVERDGQAAAPDAALLMARPFERATTTGYEGAARRGRWPTGCARRTSPRSSARST